MGQRHQLFVIAKIGGVGYIPLATVHNQWLYGLGAIYTAFRFLSLVRNPHNARVIQHELDFLALLKLDKIKKHETRAPFLAHLLVSSGRIAIDEPLEGGMSQSENWDDYCISRCYLEDPDVAPGFHDNNAGWTIFDVTEPLHPRYAYAASSVDGQYGEYFPRYRPCTAEQYVRCYYPDPSQPLPARREGEEDSDSEEDLYAFEEEVQRRLKAIESTGSGIVSLGAMAQAWPEDGFAEVLRDDFAKGKISTTASQGTQHSQALFTNQPAIVDPPSLSTLSLKKLIDHILIDDDPTACEEVRSWLQRSPQDSLVILEDAIRSQPSFNQGGIALLATFLDLALRSPNPPMDQDQILLDFSKLPLDGNQVIQTVETICSSTEDDGSARPLIRVLDVSLVRKITPFDVLAVFRLVPSIQYIIAIGCPILTRSAIASMLKLPEARELSFVHRVRSLQTYSRRGQDRNGSAIDPPPRFFCLVKTPEIWVDSFHPFFPGAYNILRNIRTLLHLKSKCILSFYDWEGSFPLRTIMGELAFGDTPRPLGIGRAIHNAGGLGCSGTELKPLEGEGSSSWGLLMVTAASEIDQKINISLKRKRTGDEDDNETSSEDEYEDPPLARKYETYKWAFVRSIKVSKELAGDGTSSPASHSEIEVADVSTFLDSISPGWKENSSNDGERESLKSIAEDVQNMFEREDNGNDDLGWTMMTKEEASRYIQESNAFFQK